MFIFLSIFYMFIISLIIFVMFMYFYINQIVIYYEMEILMLGSLNFEILFLMDWVSLMFMSVVMLISSMVLIYSIDYMDLDLFKDRFMMMVLMFVVSMLMMILSPNLMSILIGWDGLGLVSYCLVIFYQSKSSFNSGMVTVLTNRVGDIMILMSIGLLMSLSSWNFMFYSKISGFILLLLLLAAMTKSAQVPFSSWLPLAMAAPTPVSSLVHSSTLVTAGVYIMIRLNYLFMSSELVNFIMVISVITMFLSGVAANIEFDLKKIIALSTLSQLGVMFFCLSMNMGEITLFHLIIHAMFKSMLFMCAGVIIHNLMGFQDIRYMSMSLINLPLVGVIFSCSIMSLCGVPFMSGFYSKDLILEMFLMSGYYNQFMMVMVFMSMGLTLMYSMRLVMYVFIKESSVKTLSNLGLNKSLMLMSMYTLYLMSVIKGALISWLLFTDKIYIFLGFYCKMMIFYYLMMGMCLGFCLGKLNFGQKLIKFFSLIHKFLFKLWYMSVFYMTSIYNFFFMSSVMIKSFELGWNNYFMGRVLLNFFMYMYSLDLLGKNYMYLIMFIVMMIYLSFF